MNVYYWISLEPKIDARAKRPTRGSGLTDDRSGSEIERRLIRNWLSKSDKKGCYGNLAPKRHPCECIEIC